MEKYRIIFCALIVFLIVSQSATASQQEIKEENDLVNYILVVDVSLSVSKAGKQLLIEKLVYSITNELYRPGIDKMHLITFSQEPWSNSHITNPENIVKIVKDKIELVSLKNIQKTYPLYVFIQLFEYIDFSIPEHPTVVIFISDGEDNFSPENAEINNKKHVFQVLAQYGYKICPFKIPTTSNQKKTEKRNKHFKEIADSFNSTLYIINDFNDIEPSVLKLKSTLFDTPPLPLVASIEKLQNTIAYANEEKEELNQTIISLEWHNKFKNFVIGIGSFVIFSLGIFTVFYYFFYSKKVDEVKTSKSDVQKEQSLSNKPLFGKLFGPKGKTFNLYDDGKSGLLEIKASEKEAKNLVLFTLTRKDHGKIRVDYSPDVVEAEIIGAGGEKLPFSYINEETRKINLKIKSLVKGKADVGFEYEFMHPKRAIIELNKRPAESPEEFMGRDKIKKLILDKLLDHHAEHCLIHGITQVGKTSLLHQIENDTKILKKYDVIFVKKDELFTKDEIINKIDEIEETAGDKKSKPYLLFIDNYNDYYPESETKSEKLILCLVND